MESLNAVKQQIRELGSNEDELNAMDSSAQCCSAISFGLTFWSLLSPEARPEQLKAFEELGQGDTAAICHAHTDLNSLHDAALLFPTRSSLRVSSTRLVYQ